MDYFAGANSTRFGSSAGGSTAPSDFSQPQATSVIQPSPDDAAGAASPDLVDWLSSEAAYPHAGRWVLLTDELEVVDVADSPSELLNRHSDRPAPLVVFVEARGVDYAL